MNRIKFLSKIALAASVSLALAFTFSCSSDDVEESGSPVTGGKDGGGNKNPQIYNKDGTEYKGSGDIKIGKIDDMDRGLNVGSVTNGIVNLELPQTIPDEYLYEHDEDDCTVSPKDIKYSDVGFKLTDSNGKSDHLTLCAVDEQKQILEGIFYKYFSKDGKITCNTQYESEKNITNINAKAGWNKIYFHQSKEKVEKSTTKNILTKEARWTLGCG